VKRARKEGWDTKPYGQGTKGQRAVRAVEADFAYLKAWCDDEWTWCGVAVTVSMAGVDLTDEYDHALWGIECNVPGSDNSYLVEVANELLDDALDAAKAKLAELASNSLVQSLAPYVTGDDTDLDRKTFLNTVIERIQYDLAEID
jgi:hypothetical protein